VTSIEQKPQYKQHVCTDKIIQNKTMVVLEQVNATKATKTVTIKQAIMKHQLASRRELMDKSSN